jgi:flagella basal body P-ring formation protein FlgA
LNLNANIELEDTYYVDDRSVNASIITKDTKNEFSILNIDANSYVEKIKSKELIKLLSDHGFKNYNTKRSYINFILKSPIDTELLKLKLKEYYEKNYENIEIEEISIEPRSYTQTLPKNYILNIRNRDFLSKNGIVNIKTQDDKKIFFDYSIRAKVVVYVSNKVIKKESQISLQDYIKKSIPLDRFRARPIQDLQKTTLQARRHIPKDTILTQNDIELFDVVKRDAMINVTMSQDGMDITFSAKALQDAKVDDIIKVQNSNAKVLKVRVTGTDKAELE